MRAHGDTVHDDILVRTRTAMLDAFEALEAHLGSIVVIGAQAIYIRETATPVALAPYTKDADLAIDPRQLGPSPTIDEAMLRAGFTHDDANPQPGIWLRRDGDQVDEVDLMVPELLAGRRGKRSVRIPPHDNLVARQARGLEGVLVDNDLMEIRALRPSDDRVFRVRVAGPAALLVSKLFKLGERADRAPDRLLDKDAHDVYRLLVSADPIDDLQRRVQALLTHDVSRDVAVEALGYLEDLFAKGHGATGSMMAGRAERGVGEPETVSRQVAILAAELLSLFESALGRE